MVITRRQLALLAGLERQGARFPEEVAAKLLEALADLLLQVSSADLNVAEHSEEASDESSR